MLWTILKHIVRSACSRLTSSRSNPRRYKRVSYDNLWKPGSLLVKERWTDSSLLIQVTVEGNHTGEEYSSMGRTYTANALVKTSGSLLRKNRNI